MERFLTLLDEESDKAKFAELYEKYSRLMVYVAKEIIKDDYMAEDAVQEAFIRIAKNFHKINDVSCRKTKNFVVIITKNISIDMMKKHNNIAGIDEYINDKMLSYNDNYFDLFSQNSLSDGLLKLPDKYRDILYLYYLYGYSFSEVSQLLCLPVETVKKAQRARNMLKDILEKECHH